MCNMAFVKINLLHSFKFNKTKKERHQLDQSEASYLLYFMPIFSIYYTFTLSVLGNEGI